MIVPPLTMWLRVEQPARRPFRLWLPLVLVWLLLLPFFVLLVAIAAVVDVVLFLAGEEYHHYTLLLFRLCQVLAETRGTVVRVRGVNTVVDVTIA